MTRCAADRAGLPAVLLATILTVALLLSPGCSAARSPKPKPSPSPAPQRPQKLDGKLVYKATHKAERWSLRTSSGDVYKLSLGQPLDSQLLPITAGSRITLTCTPLADQPFVCGTVTGAAIVLATAPVKTTGVNIKMLVLVMSLTGSCDRSGASASNVQSAFTNPGGYIDYFNDCSYGNMVVDKSVFKVVNTPVACNGAILRCDEDALASAAQAAAVKQLGSTAVAGYTHFAYVIPTGLRETCGWVGLAELPGSQTWYTPDEWGIFRKGTVMQEVIHNFGLYHGWKGGVEYADWSTSMGEGNSCPSAPELWRLGWGTPAATLNAASLSPAGTFGTFVLPATYLGPDKNMLKITPDWLGGAYSKNVYLALRVKAGGDKDLGLDFDHRINAHEVNKNIDNSFSARGDPRVSIIGTLGERDASDIEDYKLVVRAAALVDSRTKMVVHVCRYLSSADECKEPTPESPSPSPKPSPTPSPSPKPSTSPSPSPKPSTSPSPSPSPKPSTSPSPSPKPSPSPSPSPKPSPSPSPSPKPSNKKSPPPEASPPESFPPPESSSPPEGGGGGNDDDDGGDDDNGNGGGDESSPPPAWDPCYEDDEDCEYEYGDLLAAGEPPGFTFGCFEGTDIAGKDIKTVAKVASSQDCKASCVATSGCEVGVYRSAAKTCALRSQALMGKNGRNGYDSAVESACFAKPNNGPWMCFKNVVLPGRLLYDPYESSVTACANDCYIDNFCTYFMLTSSGKCLLMDALFLGPNFQTASANPNTAVANTCLLVNLASSTASAATNYGFKASSLPSTSPGKLLWTQPPSNLLVKRRRRTMAQQQQQPQAQRVDVGSVAEMEALLAGPTALA